MKRWISLIATTALLLTATGCNETPADAPTPTAPSATPEVPVSTNTILDTDYDIAPHIVQNESSLTVLSPDKTVSLSLMTNGGQLTYSVNRDDTVYLDGGTMGLTIDSVTYGENAALGDVEAVRRIDTRFINGRTAKADAPCVQAIVPVGDMTLETRVYDNGVAFRYISAGTGARKLQSEQTTFPLPVGSALWGSTTHQFYETFTDEYDPTADPGDTLGLPVTVELKDGGYLSVLEGDLSHYPGIQLEWSDKNTFRTTFLPGQYTCQNTVTSPWRIISIADDLDELVNNTIVYQVCDDADPALFGDNWVTPGRAAWSWINGRTTASVTPDVIAQYTDYAAALGFEYNIIDEGWVTWSDAALTSLVEQGDAHGVGQILWTGMTSGASFGGGIESVDEAKAYIDYISSLGMAGAKIDFFLDERNIDMGVNIYEEILAYAAAQQLVINFHGCNKPTGQDTTYPNELNREAIYGYENMTLYDYVIQAKAFTTQPFVRNLAGHADFTPAAESAFHMAQLVLTDAPMQAFGSDPAILMELDCLEMIKSVPTVWQQTVVLEPSEIGNAAVIARQGANASWYVGGMNFMADHETIALDLSAFLGEGTYRYELWTDDGSDFCVASGTVTSADTLEVPFEALSGFIVRFDRVTLSQYGGAIDEPITIALADDRTVVRYTLDGSDPTDSSPVWQNGEALTLDDSAVLTIKITDGPDSGYTASYRFNKM